MKNILVRLNLILLIALSYTVTSHAQVVGSMKGTPSVTPNGAFTYSIPLTLPPGIKQMVPQLAISYNSMAGSGLLGYGWDLSGVSSITRVPSDIYHDRNVDPVDYDDNDALMLDGKRLIKTGLATYETAIKDFSKITASTTTYSGIQHFIVETKDGLIYEYGNTPNSQMIAAGSSYTFTWALNCVRDRNGNRIDFTYTNSPGAAVFYIAGITYGSNPLAGIPTPTTEIVFNYDIKDDKNFQYIYGAKIMSDVRMTTILIKNAGTTIHRYDMQYAVMDFYSHLIGISETGEGGAILPPTAITWGTESPTLTSGYNTSVPGDLTYGPLIADFNGDGVADIAATRYISPGGLGVPTPHYKLYKNTKTNDFSFLNEGDLAQVTSYENDAYGFIRKTYTGFRVVDFNGDGKDDMIMPSYNGANYYLFLYRANSTGTDFEAPDTLCHYINTTTTILRFHQIKYALGDFTGTKKMSVLVFVPDDEGTGPTKSYITTLIGNDFIQFGTYIGEVKDFTAMDYDGDGKDDLFVTDGFDFNSKAYSVDVPRDPATGMPLSGMALSLNPIFSSGYPNQGHRIFYGDFNGDGKRDVLTWSGAADPWEIGYAKGTGGFDVHIMPSLTLNTTDPGLSLEDNNIFVADFNGDGKDDILEMLGPGPAYVFNVIYSKGNNVFVNEPLVMSDLCGIRETHYSIGDFNGDGKADLLETSYPGCYYRIIYFHENEQKHLVHQVDKRDNSMPGNGHKYNIEYRPLATDNDYINPSVLSYPYAQRAVAGFNVVKHFYDSFNGIDNVGINSTYKYCGLTMQKLGLGFKGFEIFAAYDGITHKHTINNFDVSSWSTTVPGMSETFYTPTYEVLGRSKSTFAEATLDNNIKIIYPTQEESYDYVSNSQVLTTYTYNSDGAILPSLYHYGAPDKIITNVSGQEITTKDFVYGLWSPADPAFYNLGKPQQTTVTVHRLSWWADYVRTTNYMYNPNGQPASYTLDPGTPHANTISYIYDPMGTGNLVQESRVADGLTTTNNYGYSPDGKFMIQSANELGYTEHFTFDKWGNMLTSQDINNLTTTNHYDDFNNLVSTTSPTGITTTCNYQWATAFPSMPIYTSRPSFAVTKATTGLAGGETVFYDFAGRRIRTITNAFNGQPVYQDVYYSGNNTVLNSTDPYIVSTPPNVTSFTYDHFDRQIQQVTPTSTITTSYDPTYGPGGELGGMKTTVTNTSASPARAKTTTTDGTGKAVLVEEGVTQISNIYNCNGQVGRTYVNSTYTTEYVYDSYGNLTSQYSPNAGWTTNVYNARNQLLTTTDANAQTYTFTYDLLGRVLTKTHPADGSYTYTYGTTPSTLGKLVHESAPGTGMSTDYMYDGNSRLIQLNEMIGGTLFSTHYAYDAYNRTTSVIYPNGGLVTNGYNTYGYFTGVGTVGYGGMPVGIYSKNTVNVYGQTTSAGYAPYTGASTPGVPDPPPLYTETNTYNAHGTLTAAKLVNSSGGIMNNYIYSFNEATGDLDMRKDLKYSRAENFTYDIYDRLTSAQQSYDPAGITGTQTLDYMGGGSIIHKSDISAEPWQYDRYAVLFIPNPTAVIPTFTQTATYTSFNKIKTVDEGDKKIIFSYGADDQRRMAKYYTAGVLTKTRYYAGNYEKTVDAATGGADEICYIGAEGKLVAMYVTESTGMDVGTYMKYVLTDYQGSITHILSPTGSIVEERSYDAWGRMRTPDTWSYTGLAWYNFDRGYTGQELLKDFNILNLNGRLYDPLIGRMFSVDPYVTDRSNAQTYNAYSYANNNPLKYSDPNGEWVECAIGAVIGGFEGYEIGKAQGLKGGALWGAVFTGAGIGALSGGLGTQVTAAVGGSIPLTDMGLTNIGVIGSTVGSTLGGAVSGAGFAAISGGNVGEGIWQGALSGLAGGYIGSLAKGAGGAVLGGAASGAVGTALNKGNMGEIGLSAVIGGGVSFGSFQLMQAMNYRDFQEAGGKANRQAFDEMVNATQESMNSKDEMATHVNGNGDVNIHVGNDHYSQAGDKPPGSEQHIHTHAKTDNDFSRMKFAKDYESDEYLMRHDRHHSYWVIARQHIYTQTTPFSPIPGRMSNRIVTPYPYYNFFFGLH